MAIFVTGALRTELVMRALAAAARGEVFAVDLSGFAGGLDVAFGIEHEPGLRWGDLTETQGDIDAAGLLRRVPAVGDVRLLSHGRPVAEVPPDLQQAVIGAARRHDTTMLVEARDPLVVRALATSGDRVVVTGAGGIRDAAAMVGATQALGAAQMAVQGPDLLVLAYDVHGEAADTLTGLDADVMFVRRDRRAERALEIGLPAPARGTLHHWAVRWLGNGARI